MLPHVHHLLPTIPSKMMDNGFTVILKYDTLACFMEKLVKGDSKQSAT
jgi:hypothetical protein